MLITLIKNMRITLIKEIGSFLGRRGCRCLSLFGFLFLGIAAQAQSPGVVNGAENKASVAQSFVCALWEPLPFEVFYYDGEAYQPVKLRLKQRSERYKLPVGQTTFQLFQKQTDESGEVSYEPVGSALIPASAKVTLFLLSLAPPEAEMPLRIFGIDDSIKVFPPGSFRFVNVADRVLLISINGVKVEMKPREIRVVQPEVPDLGGFIPFFVADKDSQKVIYQTQLYGQKRGRKMGFIVINERADGREGVSIRFLSELVRAADAATDDAGAASR